MQINREQIAYFGMSCNMIRCFVTIKTYHYKLYMTSLPSEITRNCELPIKSNTLCINHPDFITYVQNLMPVFQPLLMVVDSAEIS